MSIRRSFVEQEMLTKRKRLGWLGWVTLIVTASFLLALGTWAWRTMTHQPKPVEKSPTVSIVQDEPTVPSVSQSEVGNAPTVARNENTATDEIPKAWRVFKTQNQLGQEIWDAAPGIKEWVVRDYLDALTWTDSLMFELDTLNAQLETRYAEKRLAEMRAVIAWEKQENRVIAISKVKRLPLGTVVSTFSGDGLRAQVLDYQAAGEGQVFDLKTRQPLKGNAYPNSMHMLELVYDADALRWKIAHERMIYDLDANRILWREEWDSVK